MHELKLSLLSLLMLSMPYQAMSQRNEILDDNIASLQVMNGTDWQSLLPIITLNSSDVVNISFDNFNQQYNQTGLFPPNCFQVIMSLDFLKEFL